MRSARVLLTLALLLPAPGFAQQRALVVPAEAGVIVPPRGAGSVAAPTNVRRPSLPDDAVPFGPGSGFAETAPRIPPILALIPLAGLAAVLATSLPGNGGSGGSGPARTR